MNNKSVWRRKLAKFAVGVVCFSVALIGLNTLSQRYFKVGIFGQTRIALAQNNLPKVPKDINAKIANPATVECDTGEDAPFVYQSPPQRYDDKQLDWLGFTTSHPIRVKVIDKNGKPVVGATIGVQVFLGGAPADWRDDYQLINQGRAINSLNGYSFCTVKTNASGEMIGVIHSAPRIVAANIAISAPTLSTAWQFRSKGCVGSLFALPSQPLSTTADYSDCVQEFEYYDDIHEPGDPRDLRNFFRIWPSFSASYANRVLNTAYKEYKLGLRCSQFVSDPTINKIVKGYSLLCRAEKNEHPWQRPDLLQVGVAQVQMQTLTVTKTGPGKVTSNPAGIDCGATCSAQFEQGKIITLTAAPEGGSTIQWRGEGVSCVSNVTTCQIALDKDRSVLVDFVYIANMPPKQGQDTPGGFDWKKFRATTDFGSNQDDNCLATGVPQDDLMVLGEEKLPPGSNFDKSIPLLPSSFKKNNHWLLVQFVAADGKGIENADIYFRSWGRVRKSTDNLSLTYYSIPDDDPSVSAGRVPIFGPGRSLVVSQNGLTAEVIYPERDNFALKAGIDKFNSAAKFKRCEAKTNKDGFAAINIAGLAQDVAVDLAALANGRQSQIVRVWGRDDKGNVLAGDLPKRIWANQYVNNFKNPAILDAATWPYWGFSVAFQDPVRVSYRGSQAGQLCARFFEDQTTQKEFPCNQIDLKKQAQAQTGEWAKPITLPELTASIKILKPGFGEELLVDSGKHQLEWNFIGQSSKIVKFKLTFSWIGARDDVFFAQTYGPAYLEQGPLYDFLYRAEGDNGSFYGSIFGKSSNRYEGYIVLPVPSSGQIWQMERGLANLVVRVEALDEQSKLIASDISLPFTAAFEPGLTFNLAFFPASIKEPVASGEIVFTPESNPASSEQIRLPFSTAVDWGVKTRSLPPGKYHTSVILNGYEEPLKVQITRIDYEEARAGDILEITDKQIEKASEIELEFETYLGNCRKFDGDFQICADKHQDIKPMINDPAWQTAFEDIAKQVSRLREFTHFRGTAGGKKALKQVVFTEIYNGTRIVGLSSNSLNYPERCLDDDPNNREYGNCFQDTAFFSRQYFTPITDQIKYKDLIRSVIHEYAHTVDYLYNDSGQPDFSSGEWRDAYEVLEAKGATETERERQSGQTTITGYKAAPNSNEAGAIVMSTMVQLVKDSNDDYYLDWRKLIENPKAEISTQSRFGEPGIKEKFAIAEVNEALKKHHNFMAEKILHGYRQTIASLPYFDRRLVLRQSGNNNFDAVLEK